MKHDHCKHCGACDTCDRCDHCGNCRKCGKYVQPAGTFFYPVSPYPQHTGVIYSSPQISWTLVDDGPFCSTITTPCNTSEA